MRFFNKLAENSYLDKQGGLWMKSLASGKLVQMSGEGQVYEENENTVVGDPPEVFVKDVNGGAWYQAETVVINEDGYAIQGVYGKSNPSY